MHLDTNECPTCQQKTTEIAPGEWTWEPSTYTYMGETHPCDCERQDNLRRHYLLARIPRHYWTLGELDWISTDEAALAAAKDYLTQWRHNRKEGVGIQFYSPTQGTGKTMLACLIGKGLIQRKVRVQFVTFSETLGLYDQPYEERKAWELRLRETPVLILDEVSKPFTEAQREYFAMELESLIRFRSNGNGVTIMTTNLTPQDLDTYYARTFSLLASKQQYIHVEGTDARKEMNWDEDRKRLYELGEARPIT